MRVRELMNRTLVTIAESSSCREAVELMHRARIRHLPVIENDDVVGIISIGDLVKFQSQEQSFQIKYLTEYISGGR